MIKRFINWSEIKNPETIPLNYFFLNGKILKSDENADDIIKIASCKKLNSSGFKCVPFYKKISKY